MKKLTLLLGIIRVPFLILTPTCVLLGLSTAIWTGGNINWLHSVLILIGAITAHITVNIFNEVYDFKSGLDLNTKRTPFSGGSGTLPAHPEFIATAKALAWVFFGITALVGLYFLSIQGPLILILGLPGLILLYFYTPWLTRYPILCLIAPGLGFGPVMVISVHFILSGTYSPTVLLASLIPFFLVNNLLLLNQFPDVKADLENGRNNLPIFLGRQKSSLVYGLFMGLAYLTIIIGVNQGLLPQFSLLGLLTMVIAFPAVLKVYRFAEDTQKLLPALGLNVAIILLTPILVSLGLLID